MCAHANHLLKELHLYVVANVQQVMIVRLTKLALITNVRILALAPAV